MKYIAESWEEDEDGNDLLISRECFEALSGGEARRRGQSIKSRGKCDKVTVKREKIEEEGKDS